MKTYIIRLFLKSKAMQSDTMERSELHLINFPYIELNIMDDKTFVPKLTSVNVKRVISANLYAFLDFNRHLLNEVYAVKIYDQYEDSVSEETLHRVLDYHDTISDVLKGYEKWVADNQPFAITFKEVSRPEGSIIADLVYDKEANRVYSLVFNPFKNSVDNIVNMEQYKNLILEYISNATTIAKDVLEDICVSVFREGIIYPTAHITRKEQKSDYWDEYIKKELMYGK